MRFVYSNTLGWNTFPVPMLTDQNKADLTRCAEDIDLAQRARRFMKERGRSPSITSADAWEQRLAEGATAFQRFHKEGRYGQA